MFQSFVHERRENLDDPEVRFFDESIAAKQNRSKIATLTGNKVKTTFLDNQSLDVSLELLVSHAPARRLSPGFCLLRVYIYIGQRYVHSASSVQFGSPRRWTCVSVCIFSKVESGPLWKEQATEVMAPTEIKQKLETGVACGASERKSSGCQGHGTCREDSCTVERGE